MFFSLFNESGTNDLPVEVSLYSEDNGNYRGDRMCNNALANAVVSILVAMVLMLIDLIIPCLTVQVSCILAISSCVYIHTIANVIICHEPR